MTDRKRDAICFLMIFVVFIGVTGILSMTMRVPWYGHMAGMMGFGWGFMFLIPIVFLVLLVFGAHYLITEYARTGNDERALEVLKERYAKGEITREEYLKMKKDLE